MKRFLVFGCAGYIGSVVTQYLLNKGFEVVGVDLLLYNQQKVVDQLQHPNFRFYRGCFADYALLQSLPEVDVVINLAGYVGGKISAEHPHDAHTTNVEKTIANIDFYKKRSVKYIFASSCSVYGVSLLADETTPLTPLSAYAQQKIVVEDYLRQQSMDYIVLRLATVFGPALRTRVDLLINEVVFNNLNGRLTQLYRLDDWRPYVYIHDLPPTILDVLSQPAGTVLNVGLDQNNATKRQLVSVINRVVPGQVSASPAESNDSRNYWVSFKRLQAITNGCVTTLDIGVAQLYTYLLNNPDHIGENANPDRGLM